MLVTWCKFALSYNAFYCSWLKILDKDRRPDFRQASCVARELELDVHEADSSLKALSTIHPVNTATTRSENRPKTTAHNKTLCTCLEAIIDIIATQWILFLKLFSWYLAVWILIPLTKLSLMLSPSWPLLISLSREKGGAGYPPVYFAAPGFALIRLLSFMLPTGISIRH